MLNLILKLYNDKSVQEKLTVMNAYEILFDDERNYNKKFYEDLEAMMEFGATYKLTIEKL